MDGCDGTTTSSSCVLTYRPLISGEAGCAKGHQQAVDMPNFGLDMWARRAWILQHVLDHHPLLGTLTITEGDTFVCFGNWHALVGAIINAHQPVVFGLPTHFRNVTTSGPRSLVPDGSGRVGSRWEIPVFDAHFLAMTRDVVLHLNRLLGGDARLAAVRAGKWDVRETNQTSGPLGFHGHGLGEVMAHAFGRMAGVQMCDARLVGAARFAGIAGRPKLSGPWSEKLLQHDAYYPGGSRSPADDVEAGRSPCNNYLYVHAVKSAARLEHFFDVAQSEGQGRTNYTAASMLASCRLGASRQAPARSPAGAAKPPATTPRATADVLEGSRGHLASGIHSDDSVTSVARNGTTAPARADIMVRPNLAI